MTSEGVRQAAQVLRIYLAALSAADRAAQLSVMASLIYDDRLNQSPVDPADPGAADEICRRFSGILAGHLELELILLAAASAVTDRDPAALLDDVILARPGAHE